ncbi:MAG: citramalate synthase [Spirochaetaceae bacterium]|nr:MAG: citramalate synthase [Spirochaetaceae bacterium]
MQGTEVSFTLDDKLQIAHELDEMRIDYIEGGFPLSNKKEEEFFRQAALMKFSHATVCSFGSTRRAGGSAASDPHIRALLDAQTPAVVIVGKTWKAHVEKVLGTDIDENLRMIHDSVSTCKKEGREVIFDLEHFFDGYADDPDYAVRVLQTGTDAGADVLVLCDTNGGNLPSMVSRVYAELSDRKLAPLGGHFHNDCGTAVANSLAAVDGGAIHIQGTVNGWGERCGNANLCVFIPNVVLKLGYEPACAERLPHLTSLSRFVAEKANIIPDKRQPYVGTAAFSHKAGQHADVLAKADYLMEHIDSAKVGNERHVLLSELAGKSTVVDKLGKYGDYTKSDPIVDELITALKQKERDGYEYEAAEASFDLLVRRALGIHRPLLELRNYHMESYKAHETPSKTVGRIFMQAHGRDLMGAAVGVGPVETLDAALRDALVPIYGFIGKISLTDYKVRVLNPERASAAKVRVFITSTDHEGRTWDTVGVHENIVEASWEAIVDSLEYYFNEYVEFNENVEFDEYVE